MAHKRGPKTEVPGESMARKVFMLDETRLRKLAVLAELHDPRNESAAIRRAIDLAFQRYQEQP